MKNWLDIKFWIENNFTSEICLHIPSSGLRSVILLMIHVALEMSNFFSFPSGFCNFMMIYHSMGVFSSSVPVFVLY